MGEKEDSLRWNVLFQSDFRHQFVDGRPECVALVVCRQELEEELYFLDVAFPSADTAHHDGDELDVLQVKQWGFGGPLDT